MDLPVKKLDPTAKIPTRAHATDAGLDLFSIDTLWIPGGERRRLRTGIAVAVPEGYVGLVWDKSGVSWNGGLKLLGGVIDAGYRGEIFVSLHNLSDTNYRVNAGDKVAQLLIQQVELPTPIEVEELDETARGTNAYGSTGKK